MGHITLSRADETLQLCGKLWCPSITCLDRMRR